MLGAAYDPDSGFFYDFYRDTPFTPEDLEKIEAKMWELQKRDLPYERRLTPKEEGLKRSQQCREDVTTRRFKLAARSQKLKAKS